MEMNRSEHCILLVVIMILALGSTSSQLVYDETTNSLNSEACKIYSVNNSLSCNLTQKQIEVTSIPLKVKWFTVKNESISGNLIWTLITKDSWPNNTLNISLSKPPVNYTCVIIFANGCNSSCHYIYNTTDTKFTTPFESTNIDSTPASHYYAWMTTPKSTVDAWLEDEITTRSAAFGPNTTEARPPDEADPDESTGRSHVASIFGIAIGVVLGFGVLFALGFFLYRRRRKRIQKQHQSSYPALPPGHRATAHPGSHPTVTIFTNWKQPDQKPNALEEIPRKNIVFLQTIGKGMFGTVAKADVLNINGVKGSGAKRWTTAAIKMTLIADRIHEDAKTDFLAELTLMKSIPPHPNIIKIYGSCTAHDPYLMILEFACHGDLKKYLQDQRMERNYANAAFSTYGVKPVTDGATTPLGGVTNQGYTSSTPSPIGDLVYARLNLRRLHCGTAYLRH